MIVALLGQFLTLFQQPLPSFTLHAERVTCDNNKDELANSLSFMFISPSRLEKHILETSEGDDSESMVNMDRLSICSCYMNNLNYHMMCTVGPCTSLIWGKSSDCGLDWLPTLTVRLRLLFDCIWWCQCHIRFCKASQYQENFILDI